MKSDCRAARRAVLLGEWGSELLRDHVGACGDCRRFEGAEREMAAFVRERVRRPAAPVSMRERLVSALQKERARASRKRGWWWLKVSGLGVTVVLAALGLVHMLGGEAEAHRTVEALAVDHLRYASGAGGMDLLSSDPVEVADWLRERTHLAVSVPTPPGAVVTGARRCTLRGRTAGLVQFRLPHPSGEGAARASLFAFETRREDWSRMEVVPRVRSKRICRAHGRGLSLLIWEDRGLTYAFVADLPESRMLALAEHL